MHQILHVSTCSTLVTLLLNVSLVSLVSLVYSLFIFLSNRHRRATYNQYRSYQAEIRKVTRKQRYPSIVAKSVDRAVLQMEADAMLAQHREEYNAGRVMQP